MRHSSFHRSKRTPTKKNTIGFSEYFSASSILRTLLFLGLGVSVIGVIILLSIVKDTPPIESIERGDYFQESTVIYDREKQPIYTLFNDGKRTYKDYTDISNSIKDAIISTEDKTFFENPGIDFKGLVRAGYNYVSGKTDKIKGTSTLSQQLISYTIISKERSIKRKIKEAYLSYKLNKNYSKEKILEMYLNTISFGHNANGVEEAAKTFFGKNAKDVGPLGASILASLPKGPTYYSPYLHRDRLMGELSVYPVDAPNEKIPLDNSESRKKFAKMYGAFREYLSGVTLEVRDDEIRICGVKEEYIRNTEYTPNNSCTDTTYDSLLGFFGDIVIRDQIVESGSTLDYALEYTWGRKDFVALRMFEDGKIDAPTFQKIIYDGLEYEFQKYAENIKYPYFVMYVKEYLETKYGKDIDITQGLKVYTTLDPKLQDKAESLVRDQAKTNQKQYGAKSAALVSMDNKNGALLAMVGGPDYFDTENGGNNNMTLAKRQPGSSFKPIVYALALSKRPIGPASPVADVKTSFGNWQPDNYDGKFKGVMTVEKALAYSRNIPAIKMYFLAGQEEDIAPFGNTLGLSTLRSDAGVGGALALGAEEVRPIDLMQAYSVFANLGIRRDIYMIEKILDNDENIVEEHKNPEKEDPVFSPAASYVMNAILSNIEARPDGKWREYITVGGSRRTAVKTGTSDKKVGKLANGEDKILPRDLWTAGYTPQITTVVWAGNIDGKETYGTCDGLNCAAPIWRQYMEFAHKSLAKEDWKEPEGLYKYTIVKSSGKLATEDTPADQKIQTIMAVKLGESDEGFRSIEIDTLCNGPVSENTPPGAIGTIFIPNGNPVIDGYDTDWKNAFLSSVSTSGSGRTTLPCERPAGPGNITLSVGFVGIAADADLSRKTVEGTWSGDREIKEWAVLYDTTTAKRQGIEVKKAGAGRASIEVGAGEHTITFEVTDIYGYRYTQTNRLTSGGLEESVNTPTATGSLEKPGDTLVPGTGSTLLPEIIVTRPSDKSMNIYAGDASNLRFQIQVSPGPREVSVTFAGKTIYSANIGDTFIVPIDTTDLTPGKYPLDISLTDSNFRNKKAQISITILPR